jgi:CheY-like chemotaxis protein
MTTHPPKSLLVIDDDEAVRDAFILAARRLKQTIRTAESGPEGLARVAEQRPDVIFLDLKMPGMDGVETLRRLLALDPTLVVYLVTGHYEDYLEPLKQAANDGLTFEVTSKPLSRKQLLEILDGL